MGVVPFALDSLHDQPAGKAALAHMQRGIMQVFVYLFSAYRLFWERSEREMQWNPKAFLLYSDPERRQFLKSFIRTVCFRRFLAERPRGGQVPVTLFDALVHRALVTTHKERELLSETYFHEEIKVQIGNSGRWKRRWLVISASTLLICKAKKNHRVKLQIPLPRGAGRVVEFSTEPSEEHYTCELQLWDPAETKLGCTLRCDTSASRATWSRLLRARLVHPEIIAKYERCAVDYGVGGGAGVSSRQPKSIGEAEAGGAIGSPGSGRVGNTGSVDGSRQSPTRSSTSETTDALRTLGALTQTAPDLPTKQH